MTQAMAALTMARILHLSDLHFGRDNARRWFRRWSRRAQALAPDLTVISGDLTQRARRQQYRRRCRADCSTARAGPGGARQS
jgi:predicted MPP superfamily phosphohydrolase